jgi:tripartite-type tricarboxylate transporter receptor subunit TctC
MHRFIRIAARAAIFVALAPALAWAQTSYPVKPVRMVIGFPAGSSTDVLGRVLARKLGDILGQQVIVDNKPGAGSNIAAELVAHSPGDGYTLLLGGVTNAVNVTLTPDVSFNPAKDLVPVALTATIPNILVVNPALGVSNVREFIALAKAKPGEITYGSAGNGTSPHLSGELFNLMAGTKLVHVPYKGSNQAVTDLLGGRISAMFSPASTVIPHIQSGKLKALASTTGQRPGIARDIPTVSESGLAGYDTAILFGLMAPGTTPADIVERIAGAVAQALASDDVKSQFAAQGIDPLKGGPAEYARFQAQEIEKWARVIRTAGIKAN